MPKQRDAGNRARRRHSQTLRGAVYVLVLVTIQVQRRTSNCSSAALGLGIIWRPEEGVCGWTYFCSEQLLNRACVRDAGRGRRAATQD